ncbi:Protein AaeX [Sodalis praecaptivus]
MIGEASFYGVFIPWLMLLALFFVVRRLLAAAGLYRWVWHPALFDIAFYCLLLYGLTYATSLYSGNDQ